MHLARQIHTFQQRLILKHLAKENKPYASRYRRSRIPLLSPVPPYQLFEGVYRDVKGTLIIDVFFEDIPPLEVSCVDFERVALAVDEQERYQDCRACICG